MYPETFPSRILRAVAVLLGALLALASAHALNAQAQGGTQKRLLHSEKEFRFKAGPVRLTIGINKTDISVADTAVLVVRADAPDNCLVRMPSFNGKLGRFRVVGQFDRAARLMAKHHIATTRVFHLQPSLAGLYRVPALHVPYYCIADTSNPAPSVTEGVIRTGGVKIVVHSLLTGAPKGAPGQILAPLAPVRPKQTWGIAAAIAAFVAAAALFLFIRLKSKRGISDPMEPEAHQVARAAIGEILARDLSADYAPERFFDSLDEIMRLYVRRRFDLPAAQATSEELLGALGRNPALQPRSRAFLHDLMSVCDRVKFGLYRPDKTEAGRIAHDCAVFIDDAEGQSDGNEI